MATPDAIELRLRLSKTDQELLQNIRLNEASRRKALTSLRQRLRQSRRSVFDTKKQLNSLNIQQLNGKSTILTENINNTSLLLEQMTKINPEDEAIGLLNQILTVSHKEYGFLARRLKGSIQDYNVVNRDLIKLVNKTARDQTFIKPIQTDDTNSEGIPITSYFKSSVKASMQPISKNKVNPYVSINSIGNFVVTRTNQPQTKQVFSYNQNSSYKVNDTINQTQIRSINEQREWEKKFWQEFRDQDNKGFEAIIKELKKLKNLNRDSSNSKSTSKSSLLGDLLKSFGAFGLLYSGVEIANELGLLNSDRDLQGNIDAYNKNGLGGAIANFLDPHLYKNLYESKPISKEEHQKNIESIGPLPKIEDYGNRTIVAPSADKAVDSPIINQSDVTVDRSEVVIDENIVKKFINRFMGTNNTSSVPVSSNESNNSAGSSANNPTPSPPVLSIPALPPSNNSSTPNTATKPLEPPKVSSTPSNTTPNQPVTPSLPSNLDNKQGQKSIDLPQPSKLPESTGNSTTSQSTSPNNPSSIPIEPLTTPVEPPKTDTFNKSTPSTSMSNAPMTQFPTGSSEARKSDKKSQSSNLPYIGFGNNENKGAFPNIEKTSPVNPSEATTDSEDKPTEDNSVVLDELGVDTKGNKWQGSKNAPKASLNSSSSNQYQSLTPFDKESLPDYMKRREEMGLSNGGRSEKEADTSSKFGFGKFNNTDMNERLVKGYKDTQTPGTFDYNYAKDLDSGELVRRSKERESTNDEFTPDKLLSLDDIKAIRNRQSDEDMYSGTRMFNPKPDTSGSQRIPYTKKKSRSSEDEFVDNNLDNTTIPDTSVPGGGATTSDSNVSNTREQYREEAPRTLYKHSSDLNIVAIQGVDL